MRRAIPNPNKRVVTLAEALAAADHVPELNQVNIEIDYYI